MKNVDPSELQISTDKTLLDKNIIFSFLSSSYWAYNRPKEVIQKSLDNSLCFGLYYKNAQIGFARVVTDYSIFAYLADVFVLEKFRGNGAGAILINSILHYPGLKDVKKWMLATKDAHSFYEKSGFKSLKDPLKYMEYTPSKNI